MESSSEESKSLIIVTTGEDVQPQTVEQDTYTCRTRIKGALCNTVVVVGDRSHEHGCPMEEDMCAARVCNETGSCQA